MNEMMHLINDYLCKNPIVRHNGFHRLSEEELGFALHNLTSFEMPDMYAELDDKIIIIEHFEFDASKCTKKGMKGKQEEALLKRRISYAPINNEFYFDKGDYEISLEYWRDNFDSVFDSHYGKIQKYKDSITEKLKVDSKEIIVGFFIENQFTPIVCEDLTIKEIFYFETVQFFNKIKNSHALDFILFGCYYEGCPQIFYFDSESFNECIDLINLDSKVLKLSNINDNEVTVYSNFKGC